MKRRTVALLVAAATLAAGCTTGDRLPDAQPQATTTTIEDAPGVTCNPSEEAEAQRDGERPAVASYEPLDELPGPSDVIDDAFVQGLRTKGTLVVGISPDTLLFGARNLDYTAGNTIGELPYEGFDIDMLVEVAIAIFGGDRTTIGQHLEFVAIPYGERLPKLQSNEVDLVAHTMTINCKRWKQIAFSAEYFFAGQRILVAKVSDYATIDDLNAAKAKVCVPAGSTNETNIIEGYPQIDLGKPPADISDCIVRLQRGDVDAISG
ncbi:MAG: transporter substrate-binding domain-containing protein, partial [Ilumatobacteraceae bacterium]